MSDDRHRHVLALSKSLSQWRASAARASAELRAAAESRAAGHLLLVDVRRRISDLAAELSGLRAEARDLEREDRRLGQVAERRRCERDRFAAAAEKLSARLDERLGEALAAAERDGWASALADAELSNGDRHE